MYAKKQAGVTLFELIMVLGIGALLAAFSLPEMSGVAANNRAAGYTGELVGAAAFARNEAVTRGAPVSICALPSAGATECASTTDTDWRHGWMIFVDLNGTLGSLDAGDEALRIYQSLDGDANLRSDRPAVTYSPQGSLATNAMRMELRLPGCRGEANRNLMIPLAGHPYVQSIACS